MSEDYYALLGLESRHASAQDIRSAYRKASLKVHPDRNPSPEAATLFNALFEAYELLKDAAKRAKYDQELTAKEARALRFSALDNKRKAQVAELNDREEDYKRSKEQEFQQARSKADEIQRLKDEGARLRREKDKQELDRQRTATLAGDSPAAGKTCRQQESFVQALDPLDTTLSIKWSKQALPHCATEEDIKAVLVPIIPLDQIDSLLLSSKFKANPAKSKNGSAIISLKTLSATVKLVKAATIGHPLHNVLQINWASGQTPLLAKAALALLEVTASDDLLASESELSKPIAQSTLFNAQVEPDETDILAKMKARQQERARIEEEIRQREAEEE